jgi:hypothetical protein
MSVYLPGNKNENASPNNRRGFRLHALPARKTLRRLLGQLSCRLRPGRSVHHVSPDGKSRLHRQRCGNDVRPQRVRDANLAGVDRW